MHHMVQEELCTTYSAARPSSLDLKIGVMFEDFQAACNFPRGSERVKRCDRGDDREETQPQQNGTRDTIWPRNNLLPEQANQHI